MKNIKSLTLTGLAFAIVASHTTISASLSIKNSTKSLTMSPIISSKFLSLVSDYSLASTSNERKLAKLILTIQALVNTGKVDINHMNEEGLTALHFAVLTGERDFIDYLLRAGASPAVEKEEGTSSVDAAYKRLNSTKNEIRKSKKLLTDLLQRYSKLQALLKRLSSKMTLAREPQSCSNQISEKPLNKEITDLYKEAQQALHEEITDLYKEIADKYDYLQKLAQSRKLHERIIRMFRKHTPSEARHCLNFSSMPSETSLSKRISEDTLGRLTEDEIELGEPLSPHRHALN